MSFKKFLLTASALTLLAGNAFADGGPVPEPAAPPPEPAAPPPEPAEPAPPPPPAPAMKQWYVAAHGGAVWAEDMRFETPNLAKFSTDLDVGWGAGAAIGHRYSNNWRTEVEATYRTNDGIFPAFNNADLEVSSLSFMVNALYDIDVESFFVPYVGAGIGAARVDMEFGGGRVGFEDDGWAFAYQFLGGINIPLPNTSTEFFVDYRYISTSGLDLEFGGLFDHNDEYHAHNLFGGIRFYF